MDQKRSGDGEEENGVSIIPVRPAIEDENINQSERETGDEEEKEEEEIIG